MRLKALGVERFTEGDINRWSTNLPAPIRCRLRSQNHARFKPGYAACVWSRHGSGHAVTCGNGTQESCDPESYLVSCVNSRLEDLEAAAKVLKGKKVADGVQFYLGAASKWVQEEAERRGVWQTLMDSGAHPLPAGCGPCIGLGVRPSEKGEVGISATNRNFKGRMGSRDAQCYLRALKWSLRQRSRVHPRAARIYGSKAGSYFSGIRCRRRIPRRWKFSKASPSVSKAAWFLCRRITSTPTHIRQGLHLPHELT